jgi:hypothetical protein
MELPKHFMVCISGYSGTGKDEVAKRLIAKFGAFQTGLADPAKRHMADLYGFSEDQLFGPSASRNAGDLRYPKDSFFDKNLTVSEFCSENYPKDLIGNLEPGVIYWQSSGRGFHLPNKPALPYIPLRLGSGITLIPDRHPYFWLSPREALQKYCEIMNSMYLDTWIRKGIEIHKKLAELDTNNKIFTYKYSPMLGLEFNTLGTRHRAVGNSPIITCFADFRHKHEINLTRKTTDLIPVLVRIKRPSVPDPPYDHRSEVEQSTIPDSVFDFIINNDSTLENLWTNIDNMVDDFTASQWESSGDTL